MLKTINALALLAGDRKDSGNEKFSALTIEGNVLTLRSAPHNFRAIELRWGRDPG